MRLYLKFSRSFGFAVADNADALRRRNGNNVQFVIQQSHASFIQTSSTS